MSAAEALKAALAAGIRLVVDGDDLVPDACKDYRPLPPSPSEAKPEVAYDALAPAAIASTDLELIAASGGLPKPALEP